MQTLINKGEIMKSNDSGKVLLNEGTIVMVQGPVIDVRFDEGHLPNLCLLYTSPSPRDA